MDSSRLPQKGATRKSDKETRDCDARKHQNENDHYLQSLREGASRETWQPVGMTVATTGTVSPGSGIVLDHFETYSSCRSTCPYSSTSREIALLLFAAAIAEIIHTITHSPKVTRHKIRCKTLFTGFP
jgi:hypothetical protein